MLNEFQPVKLVPQSATPNEHPLTKTASHPKDPPNEPLSSFQNSGDSDHPIRFNFVATLQFPTKLELLRGATRTRANSRPQKRPTLATSVTSLVHRRSSALLRPDPRIHRHRPKVLKELVQARERFGGMSNDGHEERPSQPAVTPIADLDDLLSKLSAWDGSSGATYDEPTSSAATQEVHRVDENGEKIPSSGVSEETHLEMEPIEPEDIDVILRMSSADFSSFADVRNGENGKVFDDDEAERMKVEAEVSSTSDLSSAGEAPVGDEIVESSHIWYACYGSNMWKKRFMCYIEGGMVEGMTKSCIGCRNKSPPVASDWISIPNRLFFGHERTRMWGLGGVAFLNPVSEPGVLSHIRIYKITMEQFNDVLSQENPGRPERYWMNGKHINELKKREPHYLMDIFGEASWYGTVKYLGEKDGLPILTFTCPESHVEKFRSGEFRTCGPPDAYRNTFVHGLVEDFGFTEEQAHEYVSSAILPKKDHNDHIDHKEGSQESLKNHRY